MFCALLSLKTYFCLECYRLRQMTTKAMPNTIASKPMISDDIPAVNSALLAEDSFVLIAKNKDKRSF
jgi:hypothetical protein